MLSGGLEVTIVAERDGFGLGGYRWVPLTADPCGDLGGRSRLMVLQESLVSPDADGENKPNWEVGLTFVWG